MIDSGQEYPVHPLDLFKPYPGIPIIDNGVETNITVCASTYKASDLDPNNGFNTFDLVLGDAFLRSVYVS